MQSAFSGQQDVNMHKLLVHLMNNCGRLQRNGVQHVREITQSAAKAAVTYAFSPSLTLLMLTILLINATIQIITSLHGHLITNQLITSEHRTKPSSVNYLLVREAAPETEHPTRRKQCRAVTGAASDVVDV